MRVRSAGAGRRSAFTSSLAAVAVVLGIVLGAGAPAEAQVCGNGLAEGGESCDDGNTVPGDCCSASCQAEPNGLPCSDGNPCTVGDQCIVGECASGLPINCSALNGQCVVGVCNPVTFGCEAQPANEGGSCDDDDLCTIADVCTGGACTGAPVNCSSLNTACTIGVCNLPVSTCVSVATNDGGSCTDGNDCTAGETCAAGQCANGSAANEGDPCDDANPCTMGESCTSGLCTSDTFLDCSALDGLCIEGVCNPQTAACVSQPVSSGTPCDDGNLCTSGETCVGGACGGGAPVDCSHLDGECTVGMCQAGTGACQPVTLGNGSACQDGDPCTSGETCTSGVCGGGGPVDCSHLDGECAVGTCNPVSGACETVGVNDGTGCDDGSVCTAGETCTGGVCGGGAPANGGGACDDGSPCTTGETCSAGACGGGAPANEGATCDDDDLCTTGEQCTAGACANGAPVDCSGLDADCALGVCNPATGTCEVQGIGEGEACDDGNTCTVGETCSGGNCAGGTAFCSMSVAKVRLFQYRQRDLWLVKLIAVLPPGFDPAQAGPFALSVFGSAGDWVHPVALPGLEPGVRRRWFFNDIVPDNEWLRIRIVPRRAGDWLVRVKARGAAILPEFPPGIYDFQVRLRWGATEISVPPAALLPFSKDTARRYP
jgi:hypothetical protein